MADRSKFQTIEVPRHVGERLRRHRVDRRQATHDIVSFLLDLADAVVRPDSWRGPVVQPNGQVTMLRDARAPLRRPRIPVGLRGYRKATVARMIKEPPPAPRH